MDDLRKELGSLVISTDGDGVAPDYDIDLLDYLGEEGLTVLVKFTEKLLQEAREQGAEEVTEGVDGQ